MLSRICIPAALLLALAIPAAAWELSAGDLTLTLDQQARVTGLKVGTQVLKVTPAPLVSLCAVARGEYLPGTVTGGDPGQGLTVDFGAAQAQARITVKAERGALRFACDLQGADLPARGMLLRFALPVEATGWQWHDDLQSARPISAGKLFENVIPLRAYASMPEWADKPALRMGYSSQNFCSVITGPVGLCLAAPLDHPTIFRTAYDTQSRQFELVYDFALAPETRQPNAASFRFDLYTCDPAWGLRGALQRYYAMYPEMFKVYVRDQGQWMAFNRLSEIDNANEFYFSLQEGAPEPEYDDKLGVISATYFTHAGMGANIPNYDPEKDPLPPYETQVAAVEAAFKRTTGEDGVYEKVGLWTAEGKLDVQKWSVYAHLIAQFNLDPELPYGAWTLKRALSNLENVRKQRNAELDGYYYDGLSTGLDYNPAHFKVAEATLLWDPVRQKPFLNNFFSSCEFARGAAELMRPLGKITMMNGAMGSSYYVAPWLDVLGEETGLRIPRSGFNYIRTLIYHKPFLTLLKGNYEKSIGRPEMELFMKRCLAYGVYPGFFDWPPSGLGPGGQYWNHANYFERDRDLFRKYQPLCRQLALAGWEPVTHARGSNPAVFVERYGPRGGVCWLTLLNEEAQAKRTTLTVDAKALGLPATGLKALDVVSGTAVALKPQGGKLVADLDVAGDGVVVLQLGAPRATAGWRVAMATEALERGQLMRQVDEAKPVTPGHWRPTGSVGREVVGADNCLVLQTDGKQTAQAWQWVMIFQGAPGDLKLKVRAAGENIAGDRAALIKCTPAWVTPNYSHYEKAEFALPGGTWDWQDLEYTISDPHPLRAVQVYLTLSGSQPGAKLRIGSVSVTDASGHDYTVDGGFDQWYEPLPDSLKPLVKTEMTALGGDLKTLGKGLDKLAAPATRQPLFAAFGRCDKLRQAIVAGKAENGARRVLRDLETIESHLSAVTLAALDIAPPTIGAPGTVAAGDTVPVTFAAPKLAGVPVKAELKCAEAKLTGGGGKWQLACPARAAAGTVLTLTGKLQIGPAGRSAVVSATRTVQVVAPLDMSLESQGFNAATGAARLRAVVRNNRRQPLTVKLAVQAPEGWRPGLTAPVKIPAQGQAALDAEVSPANKAEAGSLELTVQAVAGADQAQGRLVMLYLPKEANLLRNPGFEEGAAGWSQAAKGESGVDTTVARSGQASFRLVNPSVMENQLYQGVTLDQKLACPILVQASVKAEGVTGPRDKGFSLYVDLYYTDGTPQYGITYDFASGTTAWQQAELYIEPAKPIRTVNVYILMRGRVGKAWVDDVALMEDPRRQGNLARQATVTVDGSYSGYDPGPLNDGIIRGEGLHWTKEAWASAEGTGEHFIALAFPQPVTVARGVIYWSLDAGVPRTSRTIEVQMADGEGWRTVATLDGKEPVPQSTFRLAEPVTAQRFRLRQPPHQGPAGREDLMWVREVELMGGK